jgi:hypothetical protein
MNRNVAPRIESGADSLIAPMGDENVACHCRLGCADEPRIDIVAAAAAEDEGCVRLYFGEIEALSDVLDNLYEIHGEMIQMLQRFADTICVFASGTPMASKVDVLHELAMANAARASEAFEAFESLAEIQQVLLERQLDDLLRALDEPSLCERESSESVENQ